MKAQSVVAFAVVVALTCSSAAAAANRTYSPMEFSWQGQAVSGLPDADAVYSAEGWFPRSWSRRTSGPERLSFRAGAGRCRLSIVVSARFIAAAPTTPELLVASLYPSERPFLITRGSRTDSTPRSAVRDESAWRYGIRRPARVRKSAFNVRWVQTVATRGEKAIWGIISIDARSLPGRGICPTGYYRDGPLREEMEIVASTLRLTATID